MANKEEVKAFIIKQADEISFSPITQDQYDERLIDLGIDSLDEVELIMAIEKEYNITIPDNAVPFHLSTNKLIELTMKHL